MPRNNFSERDKQGWKPTPPSAKHFTLIDAPQAYSPALLFLFIILLLCMVMRGTGVS